MKLLIPIFAFLLAFMFCQPWASAENRIFACQIQDAVKWHSGQLEHSGVIQHFVGRGLVFDSASGLLRFFDDQPWEYRIVGRGEENDLVALRVFNGPASTFVGVLRIRTWSDPMTFTYTDSNGHLAGVCTTGK